MFSSEWLKDTANISELRKKFPDVTARETLVTSINPEFMKSNRRSISTFGERVSRWWKGVTDSISAAFSKIFNAKKDTQSPPNPVDIEAPKPEHDDAVSFSRSHPLDLYTQEGDRLDVMAEGERPIVRFSSPLEAITEEDEFKPSPSPSALKVTVDEGEPEPSPETSPSTSRRSISRRH